MDTDPPTRTPPNWLRIAPFAFLALWSGGYASAKIGLKHAEPITFLSMRFAIVLLLMLPLALILRPSLPKRAIAWWHMAFVGFLIQVVYFGLSYYAFASGVSAGGVAIIVSMQPIIVGLAAPWLNGERVGGLRWLGLLLGLAGSAGVILARSTVAIENPFGVVFAITALAGISIASLYEKRFATGEHPIIVNLVQYAVGLAGTLPIAYATETMHVTWANELGVALAYLAIGNSILAVTLLLTMIRHGEVARVSALLYLVPPGAAFIAYGLLGEVIPPWGWAGMAAAAFGVYLASRPQLPPASASSSDHAATAPTKEP